MIVILSQQNIGQSILHAAEETFSQRLNDIKVIDVPSHNCTEHIYEQLNACAQALKPSQGLLVLTDLYGSTPCNLASKFRQEKGKECIRVVAGLSLAMLIRVLNYRSSPLEMLAEKALSGAHAGVVNCEYEY